MSSKASLFGRGFAFAMTAAGALVFAEILAATPSLAQMDTAGSTTSVERSVPKEEALRMKQPPLLTREERLRAKPLDWRVTIGKPTPRVLTEEERKALERAKPEASEAGAPNPKAEEEARRLHPEDWK